MKKRIALFLILQFAMLALGGCGSENSAPGSASADKDTSVQTENSSQTLPAEEISQEDGDSYKASCTQYDYRQISRYPADYEGKRGYFQGYVQQVIEDGNNVQLLVNTTEYDWEWDDPIIVWYTRRDVNEARILEDDLVELWGELKGLHTYESLLGESITVPSMTAKYISITGESLSGNMGGSSSDQPTAEAKSEDELKSQIETTSGYTVQDYLYVDMDGDGAKEMIAGFFDADYLAEFWYCSSDGQECYLLDVDTGELPYFSMNYIAYGPESHVIINTYPENGTGYYTIISKQGADLYALCEKKWGNVYQVGREITVSIDNWDAYYDADIGWETGHAFEETYIYYDGVAYHEYPAIELTESEFYAYRDADLYPGIGFTPPSELDILKYYMRENGYVYYQFGIKNSETGEIHYFYFKYQLVDGQVVPLSGGSSAVDGQIQEYLTDLD